MLLYDLEQERICLAGILAHQDFFSSEIIFKIDEKDFYSKNSVVHKTFFLKMKSLIESGKKLDISLLSHHLKSLSLTFKDNMDLSSYLESLDLMSNNLTEEGFKNASDIIKLLSIRRTFAKVGEDITDKMKSLESSSSYENILSSVDQIVNEKVDFFESPVGQSVNLFDIMPDLVMERAADRSIFKDLGPMGPHKSVNNLCGSLSKGGHVTVICAGSGVGKTQFTSHYSMYIAGKHNIPVLHLDNGEMSEEELVFRMLSSYSRVPLHAIESGEWADDKDCKIKVENALEKIKKGQIVYDYYNVGGKNIDDIISYIKRYYFSKIGRGNSLLVNFDYIKSSFEVTGQYKAEHQVVGEMVDKLKKLVNTDLCFMGKSKVSILTSVQANRMGTVGNRSSDSVVDDESIISLSHRIKQYCSHLLILRTKTTDELQSDPIFCGRHILKIEKARALGANVARAENLVEMPDGSHKKNYINLEFDNFKITDRGDLVDLVNHQSEINDLETNADPQSDLPI